VLAIVKVVPAGVILIPVPAANVNAPESVLSEVTPPPVLGKGAHEAEGAGTGFSFSDVKTPQA
jgi:hypothetical protein